MLGEHKDEFYALSARTGATQRDSMVDIDGGIGTVFSIASKGTRELPNDTVVLDGQPERLGREGTFLGQHVYTSRPGVAVQINAFNFPVWGMLEKLAPAFIAGLPTHRQAREPDGLRHRGCRTPHHRLWPPAGGDPSAAVRVARRAARRARRAGLGLLHRLGVDRRAPAPARVRAARRRPARRRGRLPQLLDPRHRRRPPRPGVRAVHQGRRHRDDGQGRAEVHGDPPRDRALRDRRRRGRRRSPRDSRRSPSATPPATACGWVRSPRSPSATRCARRCRRCAHRPRSSSATPTSSRWSTATRDRRLHVPGTAARPPRRQRAARHRALRTGRDSHLVRRPRRRRRPGGPRPGQLAGSIVTHDPAVAPP